MSSIDKAIGVFDSGLGGISVLKELRSFMPQEDYLYFGDSSYAPYGVKTKEEITKRCRNICAFFISQGVKAVVIACNTATSACVKELRTLYPDLPIVGMEPALKPAVDGRHQHPFGSSHPIILPSYPLVVGCSWVFLLSTKICRHH